MIPPNARSAALAALLLLLGAAACKTGESQNTGGAGSTEASGGSDAQGAGDACGSCASVFAQGGEPCDDGPRAAYLALTACACTACETACKGSLCAALASDATCGACLEQQCMPQAADCAEN